MKISRILCPTDFSDASRHAVDQAVAFARFYGADITALHVVGPVISAIDHDTVAPLLRKVDAFFEPATTAGIRVNVEIRIGDTVSHILDRSSSLDIELIVMGTHGTSGFEHLVLGSVTEKVLRKAHCPVLTVPPRVAATSRLPFRHLLCSVDFSEASLSAVHWASSLACESGAALTLLHVIEWPWEEPPAPSIQDMPLEQGAALAEFRRYSEEGARKRLESLIPATMPAGQATADLRHGKAYKQILDVAEKQRSDLIIMGVRGRNAVDVTLFGSTTTQVVRGDTLEALDAAGREACTSLYEGFGADGLRVLAVAYRAIDHRDAYSRDDERDLVLAGFITFADPVLPDAADAVADLRRDGVVVKILTGDNDRVTRHICEQVGIDHRALVSGDELSRLDDAALGHVAEETAVFTRVSPAQKNRIIVALRRRGHVVGYMGDGINDAPSLHAADIGISVMTATDVARESADVILGRTGLRVLHRGILEGRQASGNLMKYLLMGTSSNFGNMFSMAAASVFLPFLPMLPTQILLNNLLYDVAQIAIPTDRVDRSYLSRPQRWDVRLIRNFMLVVGPVSSVFDFLTFYVLLRVLHATEVLFHTGWFVESLATQTLVLFVIRTMGNPLTSRPSRPLALTTIAVAAIGLALPATPLAPLLGFTVPPATYFVFLVVATVAYLVLVELVKRLVVGRLDH
jgi:nucleotide-binding universal stress UspA family protein/phosphoserine phosphatase